MRAEGLLCLLLLLGAFVLGRPQGLALPPPETPVEAHTLAFGQRLDLQNATASELEQLPGIGPARAQAILREREEQPFRSVAELERVRGIGPATRARLEPFVQVQR